jgi:hypothetical protein
LNQNTVADGFSFLSRERVLLSGSGNASSCVPAIGRLSGQRQVMCTGFVVGNPEVVSHAIRRLVVGSRPMGVIEIAPG